MELHISLWYLQIQNEESHALKKEAFKKKTKEIVQNMYIRYICKWFICTYTQTHICKFTYTYIYIYINIYACTNI